MKEFSLIGFVAHLGGMVAEMTVAEHEGLERGAVIIETEAKADIGTYQDQAGPFAAWPELAESTQADRAKHGYPENEPLLREGDMRDSIEHVVMVPEAHIGSDSQIAEWQELGTSKMPARSFLGGAAFRKGEEVAHVVGGEVVALLVGEEVVGRALAIK